MKSSIGLSLAWGSLPGTIHILHLTILVWLCEANRRINTMSPSETRTSKEKHLDMGCLQDELLRARKSPLVGFLGKALSSVDVSFHFKTSRGRTCCLLIWRKHKYWSNPWWYDLSFSNLPTRASWLLLRLCSSWRHNISSNQVASQVSISKNAQPHGLQCTNTYVHQKWAAIQPRRLPYVSLVLGRHARSTVVSSAGKSAHSNGLRDLLKPMRLFHPPNTSLLFIRHKMMGNLCTGHCSLPVRTTTGLCIRSREMQSIGGTYLRPSLSIFLNIYHLASVTEEQEELVRQVAEQEPPPQAANRQSVTENCQGWTVRVITKLVEMGIVPTAKLEMARSMVEPIWERCILSSVYHVTWTWRGRYCYSLSLAFKRRARERCCCCFSVITFCIQCPGPPTISFNMFHVNMARWYDTRVLNQIAKLISLSLYSVSQFNHSPVLGLVDNCRFRLC